MFRPCKITNLRTSVYTLHWLSCECVPETNTPISRTTTTSQKAMMVWGPCYSCRVKIINVY
jgi:hypothetical protein